MCMFSDKVPFHLGDTAISGRAVIHLFQRHKDMLRIGTMLLLDIGVGNRLAAESFLENLAVMGLSIDVKALCGRSTKNDTGYERHYRDFASRHRLGLLSWVIEPPSRRQHHSVTRNISYPCVPATECKCLLAKNCRSQMVPAHHPRPAWGAWGGWKRMLPPRRCGTQRSAESPPRGVAPETYRKRKSRP